MKYGFIKVAACSPKVTVADCNANSAEIIAAIDEAYKNGVKLLVFPELSVTGYTCGDLFYQSALLDAAERAVSTIAAYTVNKEMLVFIGAPLRKDNKIYNTAVALYNGGILGVVPKTNLPNYNEFYEKRQFSKADDGVSVISVGGGVDCLFGTKLLFRAKALPSFTVAAEICEDLWVMNPPSVSHAMAGATVIANLSASNETIGKADYRRTLVTTASAKLVAGYVYADAGEGESTTDTVFSGHNLIAENGTVLAESKLFSEGLIISEIDVNALSYERTKIAGYCKENKEYTVIPFDMQIITARLTRKISPSPFVPEGAELDERSELILSLQSHALARRLAHCHAKCAVIGVSGGLDSSLALLVAVKAAKLLEMPLTDIIAVTMPCFGTTKRTKGNADKLMAALGVTAKTVDIKKAVSLHFKDIGQDEGNFDVAYENAQARERTQVLMDIANSRGGLVIGTGDLSELALGWATYNGDHMSMYGVNAGVPKTLVSHLIRYEANKTDDKLLKKTLLDVADTDISPELLPPDASGNITQKTEDKVGPYRLHDFFLYYLIRKGFLPSKVLYIATYAFKSEFDVETIKKWEKVFIRRFFAQQFKRSCLPDGVKIGSVTLSPRGDWRMPSDASPEVWLNELEGEQ